MGHFKKALFGAALFAGTATVQANTQTDINSVTFNDQQLKDCVLNTAGQQLLTYAEQLTQLQCNSLSISDLTGLEYFTGLELLALSQNNLSSLQPLANLNQLKTLFIGDNNVTDLSPLANLTAITDLSLRANKITDISPLQRLHAMQKLYLRENSVSDLSVLSAMTQLTHLYAQNNQIQQLSPLLSNKNLTLLNVESNALVDISSLNSIAGLSEIYLAENTEIPCEQLDALNSQFGNSVKSQPQSCVSSYIKDVVFSDDNLARCVADYTASRGWTLLEQVTELRCGDKNIVQLDGLEHFTALTFLDLSINKIQSIAPLSDLRLLHTLFLGDNQIADITPLQNLKALTQLSLRSNRITQLQPLADLTALTKLYLWGNNISDISLLSNLTALTELWLAANNISDLSPLAGLNNLTLLSIADNYISDISVLDNLTSLSTLNLDNNNNISCDALNELQTRFGGNDLTLPQSCSSQPLAELSFADPNLKQCVQDYAANNGWSTLHEMVQLRCGNKNLNNIEGIEQLKELNFLDLSLNQISDVTPLANLAKLQTLYLGDNNISNIDGLSALQNLTEISLRTNRLTDISALSSLTNLHTLFLRDNQITSLSALSSLTRLTKVWLSQNQINDVSPLGNLTAMEQLYLQNNQIQSVSALKALSSAQTIVLEGNNDIYCSELSDLTATLGSAVVDAPESCMPIAGIVEQNYFVRQGEQLSVFIANHFNDAQGSLSLQAGGSINSVQLQNGTLEYYANSLGKDSIEVSLVQNGSIYQKLKLNIQVAFGVLEQGYPSISGAGGQLKYGYSAFPGETVSWHLDATASGEQELTITDVAGQVVDTVKANVSPQNISNSQPWKNGFGYRKTFDYTVPADMASGVYYLDGNRQIFFVVKKPTAADVLVVVPTNSMNAYACTGGRSLYPCTINGEKVDAVPKVSFLRPIADRRKYYTDKLQLINPMLKWFEYEQRVNASVSYITDYELDDLNYISGSKVLAILGHNEYWSHQGQKNFDHFTHTQGKNAWVLGGNIIWWATRYEDQGNTLVSFKYYEDTEAPSDDLRTVLLMSVGIDPVKSIGGLFHYGGYDNNKVDSFGSPNPMRITKPDSPMFAGTGIGLCSNIDMGKNVEFDGAPLAGFDQNGLPIPEKDSRGIYRLEILGYTWGQRSNKHTLGSIHVMQKSPSAGTVIQVGSIGSTYGAFKNDSDGTYRKVMSNMLNILSNDLYPFTSDIDTPAAVATPLATPIAPADFPQFNERCAR